MPIYEYRCEDCGTKFEKLIRRDSDVESLVCPKCGERRLAQELSTFAAHAAAAKSPAPMACPSGGVCRNPDFCGGSMN
jgi:putative FmdB family regulatory protein